MKTHRHNPNRSNLYEEKMTFCGITGFHTYGDLPRTLEGGWTAYRRQANPLEWTDGFPSCMNCQYVMSKNGIGR